MSKWQWRAFGVAFLVTGAVALLAAIIETVLSNPAGAGRPGVRDLLHAFDLHLLAALGVTFILRMLFWTSTERSFPPIALGVFLVVEIGIVAAYWVNQLRFAPPIGTLAGRAVAVAMVLAGVAVALALARLLSRLIPRETWVRWVRGLAGALGIGAAVALLIVTAVLVWSAYPRGAAQVAVREDAASRGRPDVFVILIDTLRRDHLSGFGYQRPTSPNIDRLLDDSYVFTAAYTPSTWTIPSVASLFTGLYPTSHRIKSAVHRVPEDAPTLAEHFRSYGYRTGAFVANHIITRSNGYAQGFETFFPEPPPWWTYRRRTAFERVATRLRRPGDADRGQRINREALRWLAATPGEPHFVYLHYMEPHSPYAPQQRALDAVAPGAPWGPADPPFFNDYKETIADPGCRDWECLENPPTLPPREVEGMVARYDGEIYAVDRAIGDFLKGLSEIGLLERSHVLFLTDHGEEFGDHQGWFHGNSIYEEMTGSPTAYRPPGGLPGDIEGARVIERPVAILDLASTLCCLLGFETPPMHQGRRIPELFGESPPEGETPVLSELPPWLYSLRLGRWKLIRRGSTGSPNERLYDLSADPLERMDLSVELPDTLAYLRGYLEGMLADFSQTSLDEVTATSDPELLERLKTLGYIR
jgi:arylsulfatase A-like enzyme